MKTFALLIKFSEKFSEYAAEFNKFWKDTDVTLIESSKIGILGAGEGGTPNFGRMLALLDINQKDKNSTLIFYIKWSEKISDEIINNQEQKIKNWLKFKLKDQTFEIIRF